MQGGLVKPSYLGVWPIYIIYKRPYEIPLDILLSEISVIYQDMCNA